MDILNAHDLTALSDQRGGFRVSVFLPTHRAGRQTERNAIRLKNLLRQAEQALIDDGLSAAATDQMIEPGRRLLDRARSWERLSDGLAVFLDPSGIQHFRVPLRLPELTAVGDRFLTRPLLPLLSTGGHFYVLALSQDEIKLFRGSRYGLDEVAVDGLALAVWLTMPRRRTPVHAFVADRGGTGGRAVFHGIEDDTTPLVLQHFRRVDRALREVLQADAAPLVLAGVRSTQALYRQVNTYAALMGDGVDGNPWDLGPEQLHRHAWPLVEPVLCGEETIAAGAYKQLRGTGRTCTDTVAVGAAAREGRVETLFVRTDAPGTGKRTVIRLHEHTGEVDHLDDAAISTLRHSGTVYAVPRDRMPDTSPMAATLRY
ncbi:baeRF3 domain-containing protein [Jidongwangia harbinensis]|uniref:baeRF3 domain-containing protein n=1 Tax=Jidongwangia harbinensis TaxID=2878561 RepID=UPI001CDA2A5B|nr:hypothetical protein [Jidongwangia harbinensis]MCA2218901.1 hypothetical protein [Jidongwangia harbinensis]